MDTGIYDLKLTQYADYSKIFTCYDADNSLTDLTGYTADLAIRDKQIGTTTLLSLDETSGITLGGTLGTIQIDIASSTSSTLTSNKYWYYLELHTGTITERLLQGDVYINLR